MSADGYWRDLRAARNPAYHCARDVPSDRRRPTTCRLPSSLPTTRGRVSANHHRTDARTGLDTAPVDMTYALTCPNLAEREGFEPTVSFPSHDFQSCRFGRSRTPPAPRQASLKGPSTLGPGREEPGAGRGGRALRNGAPQTGSGPDGSSPQRTAPCAVGNLTVAPGTRPMLPPSIRPCLPCFK